MKHAHANMNYKQLNETCTSKHNYKQLNKTCTSKHEL